MVPYFIESVAADKSLDATEEPERQVIVTDAAQENDSSGLVVSQKRY